MKFDLMKVLGTGHKPGTETAPSKKTRGGPSVFEAALVDARQLPKKETKADLSPARAAKDEKKARLDTGTEEALLVSRTLTAHARFTPLIVTKPADLKTDKTVQLSAHHKPEHTAPAETHKKTKPVEEAAPKLDRKNDDPSVPVANPTAVLAPPTEPFRIEAPNVLKDAAPLSQVAPMMMDDASMRAVLLPTIARVSMEIENSGRLNLQLKVNDGVTDIRAAGPAAQLLESRQGEIRVALAKEGLALGHFDLTQSGSQQRHERPEFDASTPTARRASSSSSDITVEDGRVHVKV